MNEDYLTNKPDEPLFNCQQCGTPEAAYYTKDRRNLLIHHQLCFSCCFWVERFYMHITDSNSVIVSGEAYMAHPFDSSGRTYLKGHGGRLFTFKLNDGSVLESNDVWAQGTVPDHFRHVMPDTARMAEGRVNIL